MTTYFECTSTKQLAADRPELVIQVHMEKLESEDQGRLRRLSSSQFMLEEQI